MRLISPSFLHVRTCPQATVVHLDQYAPHHRQSICPLRSLAPLREAFSCNSAYSLKSVILRNICNPFLYCLTGFAHDPFRAGEAPSGSAPIESMDQQNEAAVPSVKALADTFFHEISARLETQVQKQEWTNRPRTWYILNQIKRLDAMEAFIVQGLNDTSLPYKGRSSLPNTLNVNEANDFLKWQNSVISDVLYLEQGKHVRIANGDVLFESKGRKLGVGSQG